MKLRGGKIIGSVENHKDKAQKVKQRGRPKKSNGNEDIQLREVSAVNTTVEDDNDVEYINTYTQNVTRYFNPVDKEWQREKCELLKLRPCRSRVCLKKCQLLESPLVIRPVVEDGNCLFRSLSYCITGTQNNHRDIRKKVVKILKTNAQIRNYLDGKTRLKNYLKEKKIEVDGVRETDVEIYAAAIMLNTPIYVYLTRKKKWHLFNKNIEIKTSPEKTEKCIYLYNDEYGYLSVVTYVDNVN